MTVLDTNHPVKTWSRNTVADGDWLNINTIQPLIDRTNEIEEDQAALLNGETELLDSYSDDMQLKPGNRVYLDANHNTKELTIGIIKSVVKIAGDNIVAKTVKFTIDPEQAQAYYDLNNGILEENIKRYDGTKITLENNKIFLEPGFYLVNCSIALKKAESFVSSNTKEFTFRLLADIGDLDNSQPTNMSCKIDNIDTIPVDAGYFNMTFSLNVYVKTNLVLILCNRDNIINYDPLDTHILKSLTIIEE